jgi:hypothetical protein
MNNFWVNCAGYLQNSEIFPETKIIFQIVQTWSLQELIEILDWSKKPTAKDSK